MAYCVPSEVLFIIHTGMPETDITSLIVIVQGEVDLLISGLTLTDDQKRLITMLLTASLIGDKDPNSYAIGLARVQYGERVDNWRQRALKIVERLKLSTSGSKIKASEYRKIDEDLRYPA